MKRWIVDHRMSRLSPQPVNLIFEVLTMHTETDHIPDVYRALIGQLSTRGLMSVEIERLVEDALSLLCREGDLTMSVLNQRLESLGWKREIVDSITFRLIIYLLEKEYFYEVWEISIH